ncbi:DUF3267 domain-containing protein [Methanofollis fontis]|uniref:DUF3267 domain-containing protein n=1 Tax=Methanofollis fontis TaxID=2052832 RepID=A0A483CT47_9EURY|nr:DUF3267 domain-containing protein [Methanofollis fontis]TAJ45524.1 hypothetical protein CUJ86_02005 [Methanofollis fontis]
MDLPDRHIIRVVTLSGDRPLLLTVWSFILFFVFLAIGIVVYASATGDASFTFTVRSLPDLLPLFALVILILLVGAIHEGLHALAYLLLHRRPLFGWGRTSLLFYCSCSADGEYTRSESIFVLVAPFVLITALGIGAIAVAPAWGIAALIAVPLNAAGSAADLRAAGLILRTPQKSLVLEEGGTLTVFVRE